MQRKYPMLYREQCTHLCDRSTLQLAKWIATYEECRGLIDRANTVERRRLINIVKKAFRQKHKVQGYTRVSLFSEPQSTLIRRSTAFLTSWVEKYRMIDGTRAAKFTRNTRGVESPYCQICVEDNTKEIQNTALGGSHGKDRGDREGSSDLLPP